VILELQLAINFISTYTFCLTVFADVPKRITPSLLMGLDGLIYTLFGPSSALIGGYFAPANNTWRWDLRLYEFTRG